MSDPLQETRRLSKAAYPGPWVYRVSGDAVYLDAPKPNGSVRCIAASIHSEQDEANYALMAAARELLPTLAQRVEDAETALIEVHEFQCGCDRPGNPASCTAEPPLVFEVLGDARQALRQEDQ